VPIATSAEQPFAILVRPGEPLAEIAAKVLLLSGLTVFATTLGATAHLV
jgi:hypothetical protein